MEKTLGQIVPAAVETIPGVEAGSISITENGRIETRHPTAENIRKLDRTQSELNEGPCITAIEDPPDGGMVIAHDLAGPDGRRWPHYAPHAVDAGFRALTSVQLSTEGGVRVALNTEQAEHLQRAVDSRDLIGRAKGILMERFKVDDEGAFQMLVKSSQGTNIKPTAVAQWLNENVATAPSPRLDQSGSL
jgi:hypothetical protein